ncbi:nucleoside phosphorylase domain-containing protein [Phyllosticta citricarpa]
MSNPNKYTLSNFWTKNTKDQKYGLTSAATVATDMLHYFVNVKIGLMVCIAGGAPTTKHDIRLGDIVVSSQRPSVPEHSISQSTTTLLRAADHEMDVHKFEENISSILESKERRREKFSRPDLGTDRLFKSEYTQHGQDIDDPCSDVCGTDEENLVSRPDREKRIDDPVVHYGVIASANQLMKDATIRDKLAKEKNVLCFEMKAAGLMNHYPCMAIRGMCDYSDSHKNKEWEGYAAMTAATYAKALLCRIAPTGVEAETKLNDAMTEKSQDFQSLKTGNSEIRSLVTDLDSKIQSKDIQNWWSPPEPYLNYHNAIAKRYENTGSWLLEYIVHDE